jgi:putative transposase
MPRRPRVVVTGIAHHITQRGNNRQLIFRSDRDRTRYLDLLGRQAVANQLRILGYCVMTNHVHLVAVPERSESLSRALGRAHSEYALEWNRAGGGSGHVWQGRFFSCPLNESHLRMALRYVDLNPVRAQLVGSAIDWPWSSARAHADLSVHDSLLDYRWTEHLRYWDHAEWANVLGESADGEWDELRRSTMTGAPLGPSEFVRQIEKEKGRRLRVFETGRPRKPKESDGIPGSQESFFEGLGK